MPFLPPEANRVRWGQRGLPLGVDDWPLDEPLDVPIDEPLDDEPDGPRDRLPVLPLLRVEWLVRPEPFRLLFIVPELPDPIDPLIELDPLVPLAVPV